jgi:F-type H+-transporting ATPase subunit b
MYASIALLVLAAESVSDKKDIYPKPAELIIGALAFAVLFVFMAKWVLPRVNALLEERREKIQGDLEKAEESRSEAEKMLDDYRQQLSGARDEANRIIEEARRTADSMRRDLEAKAEQEAQQIIARAQDEIRAERDRVFQELRAQVGELSLVLAEKTVAASLDRERHLRMVDEFISELSSMPASSNGNGHTPSGGEGSGA